ncbi:ABC transporter permease [Filimonas effusa]|uniref:Uncharacterized protein n=1 Tax=Filimonas effusa TaxID=2508721 RepID=A0A4Q1D0H6_9BACT|nr:ABC transporter permease [Filimonas effusa]RXK81229.1 hypothetical protein ESB13_20030 [Filimonas effusa]
MWQLLKIEWLKVKNYRTFWILAGLFVISVVGLNSIVHEFQVAKPGTKGMDAAAAMLLGAPPFRFPDVWHTVSWLSGFMLFIPCLLIVILTTNEFNFKTHRQNVIDGLSRTEFVIAKIADVVVIALASTIIVAITVLIFGFAEGNASFSFDKAEYLLYFFIQALSYGSVALLMSVLFKRSGITIGILFLYISVLERLVQWLFIKTGLPDAGDFLPLRSVSNLIPFPFLKVITSQMFKYQDTLYLLIAAFIYLALYVFVVKKRFETVDL